MILPDNIKFVPLSPISNADEDGHYQSAIEFALNDVSIKNIAITGRYGAGKSSIIHTFINNNSNKWKFLNISLATFANSKPNQAGTPIDIQAIERSILQQFFYKVGQHRIPLSRFKRIVSNSINNLHRNVIFVGIFILSLFFIFFEEQAVNKGIRLDDWYPGFNYLVALIFGYTIVVATLNYLINLKELRLKLHDAEIHIGEIRSKSVLNDHLDEILYFFECTQYDVVIIEDLDRFDEIEIFTRLRELNSIINNAEQVERSIRFVYAIRDDLLDTESRTKFFDFIIPVIPTINPNNAYDHIKAEYSKFGIEESLLAQISLYFDDLRIVKNIFNEFQIYLSKIGKTITSVDKLFSMIVYKNFDPKDFGKLHSNEGNLFAIFNGAKIRAISSAEAKINEDIKNIEIYRSHVEQENLQSVDELNRIYVSGLFDFLQEGYNTQGDYIIHLRVIVDGDAYTFKQLLIDENFVKLADSDSIGISVRRSTVVDRLTFSDLEKVVNEESSYKTRRSLILAKQQEEKSNLEKDLQRLKTERENIRSLSFNELIRMHPVIPSWPEETAPILKFLTTNGFIDETYPDLISYFFESTISQSDKIFAIRVNNGEHPTFEFKLQRVAELVDRFIGVYCFGKPSILNFDLVDYLITAAGDRCGQQKRLLVQLLRREDEISLRFVVDYLHRGDNLNEFLQAIYSVESGLLNRIISHEESVINSAIIPILCNLDPNSVKGGGNEFESIRNYMGSFSPIVKLLAEQWNNHSINITDWISLVKPVLENLVADHEEKQVVDVLLVNNCVYVNKNNVGSLAKIYIKGQSLIKQQPFSAFLSAGQVLHDHVWSHIDQYSEYFLSEVNLLIEPHDLMVELLNDKHISINTRLLMVDKMAVSISDISLIEESQVRKRLMSRSKVVPAWCNLLFYFNESSEVDEAFAGYINIDVNRRSLSEEDFDIDDETRAEFEFAIMTSQLIEDETIGLIASKLEYEFPDMELSVLSETRLRLLISAGTIELSDSNLGQMRELSTQLLKLFLRENIDHLIAPEGLFVAKASDYEVVLEGCTDNILINNILLGGAYDFIPNSKKLQEIALKNYNKGSIPEKIFDSIYYSCGNDEKIILITQYADFFSRDRIKKLVEDFSDETSALFSSGDILQLPNTEPYRKFANILYDKGLIVKPKLKGSGYFKGLELKARKR